MAVPGPKGYENGHPVIFTHPDLDRDLTVVTGPNQIEWSYGLNTQSFQTYAGEVVQILSAYTDNLSINGNVTSYAQMEEIYEWFLSYISIATQGSNASDANSGLLSYNEKPVTMSYPHRGWTLKIKPLNLPNLRMGREVVVPAWSMEAAVVEDNMEMQALALEAANLGDFKKLDASIGFREHNPFSDPQYSPKDIKKYLGEQTKLTTVTDVTDWYTSLLTAYTGGDTSGLTDPVKIGSKPAATPSSDSSSTSGS